MINIGVGGELGDKGPTSWGGEGGMGRRRRVWGNTPVGGPAGQTRHGACIVHHRRSKSPRQGKDAENAPHSTNGLALVNFCRQGANVFASALGSREQLQCG